MDLLSLSMQQPAAPERAGSVDSREHLSRRGCNADDNHQPSLELELKLSWPPDLEPARTINSLDGKHWHRPVAEEEATAKANYGPCNSSNDSRGRRPAAVHAAPSSSDLGGPCFSGGTSCSADEDDGRPGNGPPRKKLRLTKEQSCYLEESFKEHTTVSPKQKLAIAKRLNLQPRQVEVWFQNRRARTKLKQTEVDFEYLKHCCETLTEENRRLHRELQELRSLEPAALASHLQGQSSPSVAATTLSLCPMCKRAAMAGIGMAKKLGGNFNIQQVKQEEVAYHHHHHHPKLASQVG